MLMPNLAERGSKDDDSVYEPQDESSSNDLSERESKETNKMPRMIDLKNSCLRRSKRDEEQPDRLTPNKLGFFS